MEEVTIDRRLDFNKFIYEKERYSEQCHEWVYNMFKKRNTHTNKKDVPRAIVVHPTNAAVYLGAMMRSIRLPNPAGITEDWQTMYVANKCVFLIYLVQSDRWSRPALYYSKIIQNGPIALIACVVNGAGFTMSPQW